MKEEPGRDDSRGEGVIPARLREPAAEEVVRLHTVQKRYDVICARSFGLRPQEVHRFTGVPPRTQSRIIREEISYSMQDQELRSARAVGRPTTLPPELRSTIDTLLAAEPEIRVAELLRRLRSDHDYGGGKTAVYDYVAAHRPARPGPLPVVRFEGVPGEFAQHDFGTLTVRYEDGATEKLTFYAGRMKYSRALHVCLLPGETTEGLIRGMEGFAAALGGLALVNVIDNARTAVIRRTKNPATGADTIEYQQHFRSFIQEAEVLAEPTYPYSGNQKGAVENLVGFVKTSFLQARRFRHRRDLEAQLGEWLHYVNHERPCDATGVPPAQRLEEERPYLRPLAFGPDGYGLLRTAVVSSSARVRCLGYEYSTPAKWIGQPVTVRVHREVVVLHYAGQQVCHPRVPSNGNYSLLPEHREALFVKPRGALMAKRQIPGALWAVTSARKRSASSPNWCPGAPRPGASGTYPRRGSSSSARGKSGWWKPSATAPTEEPSVRSISGPGPKG